MKKNLNFNKRPFFSQGQKRAIVTGCAGFIGSNLCEMLIKYGYKVIGLDNLSTGKFQFLNKIITSKNFTFYKVDLYKKKNLSRYFKKQDIVFHLAANADVKNGLLYPRRDLEQNTIVTFNVLNAMKKNNVKKIVFSSTGSIYGEHQSFPTKENASFPVQTSLYGSSKLACEGLIQAFSYGYNIKAYIFRFVSLLGKNYTHGHLFDFYKQLKNNKKKLIVLGDGNQKKSYLNVSDCIDAIFFALKKNKKNIYIYNLGTDNYITVKQSIKYILNFSKLNPKIFFKGGKRGWIGDSPKIFLSIEKMKKTGWSPKKTIKESIFETLEYFQENKWLFKK